MANKIERRMPSDAVYFFIGASRMKTCYNWPQVKSKSRLREALSQQRLELMIFRKYFITNLHTAGLSVN